MFVRPRSSATKPPGRMASADPWPWLGAGDVILAMENHGKAAFFEGNWWLSRFLPQETDVNQLEISSQWWI